MHSKHFILPAVIIFSLFFFACKDDQQINGDSTPKNCLISSVKIEGEDYRSYTYKDGFVQEMTRDNRHVHKVIYDETKLSSVIRTSQTDPDTLIYVYDQNNILVERYNLFEGKRDGFHRYEWNPDGTIKSIQEFVDSGDTIYGPVTGLFFLYQAADLKEIIAIEDEDFNGILDTLKDSYEQYKFITSEIANPLYGYYLFEYHLIDAALDIATFFFTKNQPSQVALYQDGIYQETFDYTSTLNANGDLGQTTLDYNDGDPLVPFTYSYECK